MGGICMKNKTSKKRLSGNLQLLAVSAFLAALSIICGKYLALSLGNVLRFSFENLPIVLAGVAFGPVFPGEDARLHNSNEGISEENFWKHAQICLEAMYRMYIAE